MRFACALLATACFAVATIAVAQDTTAPGPAFELPRPPAEAVDTIGEDVVPDPKGDEVVEVDTAQTPAEAAPVTEPASLQPARRPIDRAVLAQLEPPVVQGFNPSLPDGGVGRKADSESCPEVPRSMHVGGQMRVQPGRSYMLAVSRKHLSRLVTPFSQPDAISNSQSHEVLVEGRSLLLSLPPHSCEPLGLFVFDKAGDPELAINLTLWPQDIPQVDVKLELPEELAERLATAVQESSLVAPAWDYRTPHVDALTTIMKPLALGQVPPGFSLKPVRGRDNGVPVCVFPGASVVFRQVLDGGRIKVYVASVKSASRSPLEIRESDCAAPGVQAVAAWPSPLLDPSGTAELFVIVDTPVSSAVRTRPSVLE